MVERSGKFNSSGLDMREHYYRIDNGKRQDLTTYFL